MRRYRLLTVAFSIPALAVFLAAIGCSSGENKEPEIKIKKRSNHTTAGGGAAVGPSKPIAELASKGWATLQGKVTFDGDPPEEKFLDINKDVGQCNCEAAKQRGDTRVQTWKVGPNKGVANVVVWLRAPKGKWFKIPDDKKYRTDVVKLDQPYCAFEPHVLVLNPTYYDLAQNKQVPSGQVFEVVNSAPIAHNTNYVPSDSTINSGTNMLLEKAKAQGQPVDIRKIPFKASPPNKVGGEQRISFTCNIHTWMSGFAWVFDHPFAAVTNGDLKIDKDFGSYEIKEVPAGVPVDIVYWHDSMTRPAKLKTVTFETGKTMTVDFSIK